MYQLCKWTAYAGQTLGQCPNSTPTFQCEPVYTVNVTERRSDGFILEESAMTGPGANIGSQFMPGSNHLQMRNDNNTERARDFILQGTLNSYFNSTR
jgi:hypothetical protein